MLAIQEAQKFGVNLRVSAGGETIDPLKMVLARQDDIGVASGDILMKAVADGAPLVAIGVVNDTSPTCFVAKQASGITRLQDFANKRVGVLKGTNTERIYRLMLRRNNIDPKTITEVDAPFDLNTFILGQYDVRPAFAYDEPVTLAASKIAINMIRPLDYGVKSIGTVYFTRRELLEQREADLVGTLAALITGWRAATTPVGQQKAIDTLKKAFPEIDAKRELESLRLAIPYFEGPAGSGRPLTVSQDHLNDTLAGLVELGEVKAGLKVEQFWTDKLLNKAYERLKG
jgi:ABC-type nitrate/sulfonate/bicarbonate transport system substrate-binding protein